VNYKEAQGPDHQLHGRIVPAQKRKLVAFKVQKIFKNDASTQCALVFNTRTLHPHQHCRGTATLRYKKPNGCTISCMVGLRQAPSSCRASLTAANTHLARNSKPTALLPAGETHSEQHVSRHAANHIPNDC
jgi:hypothetical protein